MSGKLQTRWTEKAYLDTFVDKKRLFVSLFLRNGMWLCTIKQKARQKKNLMIV